MVGYLRLKERGRRATLIGIGVASVLGLIAARAATALAGTKTGVALSLLVTIGPPLLYAAVMAPIVFPLGAYVLLVPLDGLLDTGALGTVTKLLGALTAGALLLYMLRCKRAIEPPRASAWWLLLYLWTTASLFWAIDTQTAEQALPTVLELFGLYIVVAMFPITNSGLRSIVNMTIAGSAIAAVYAVYFFHTAAGQAAAANSRLFLSTDSGVINPDHLAAAMVLPVALACIAVIYNRNLLIRLACLASVAAMLWTVDLSSSRGGAVAVAAAILYLLIRDRHRLVLGTGLGALVALVLATSGQSLIQRFATASVNGGAGRTDIWHVGLLAFKEHWLFGAGYANFPFAYDAAFIRVPELFYTKWHRASHDIVLNTAVELGAIGLLLLICAWGSHFRLLSFVKPDHHLYPLRLALEAAIVGLFIAGLFADIMTMKYAWMPFMLVVLARNAVLSERNAKSNA